MCLDLNQDAKLLHLLYMVLASLKLCCVMFRFGSTGDCILYAAKLDHKGLHKEQNIAEMLQRVNSFYSLNDTAVKMLHVHDLLR